MPRYKVKAPGFFGGKMYHPEGKRPILHVDKPFTEKDMPSWVEEMPDETAEETEARLQREAAEADAAKEKNDQDQQDIDDMTFLGDGESSDGVSSDTDAGVVETL